MFDAWDEICFLDLYIVFKVSDKAKWTLLHFNKNNNRYYVKIRC